MNFMELMNAANESRTSRNAGQRTPGACKVWREIDPETSCLLEVAIAWEMTIDQRTHQINEATVRDVRRH